MMNWLFLKRDKIIIVKLVNCGFPRGSSELFQPQVTCGRQQIRPQRSSSRLKTSWRLYQTQKAIVGNVFGQLDRPTQPVREAEHPAPVPLVQFNEGCRFASSCLFKQKFVCVSIWQSALDSAGIAPTSITGRRQKDTLLLMRGRSGFP